MLRPGIEDLGLTAQHDPAEPPPIFVVAVDDEPGLRVLQDVAHPFQRDVAPLRLLVDGDVERFVVRGKADRDQVRRTLRIGGGEMPDPARFEKAALTLGKHGGSLRQSRAGCLALCPGRTMPPCARWRGS